MKKYDGSLFILVDALGWEIHKRFQFLNELGFKDKSLRSVLGYSSTCYPSIFTSKNPQEHGLWNSYYYSKNPVSPDWIKYLQYLPFKIRNSWKVRGLVCKYLKSRIKSKGYFSLYRVPFEYLKYFGYAEDIEIMNPKALKYESIFDIAESLKLSRCIPHYAKSDQEKLNEIYDALNSNNPPQFTFTALGSLDTFMHAHGPDGQKVDNFLKDLESKTLTVIKKAKETYKNPFIGIFSDHGMARVNSTANIWPEINSLGLEYGTDYIAFYDATMARFWYLNEKARKKINIKLDSKEFSKFGKRLSPEELKEEGCFFQDHKYGEEIFLTNPGIEIIPSFMSDKMLSGMHGYHPDEKDSWGTLLCNQEITPNIVSIKDLFFMMKEAAEKTL